MELWKNSEMMEITSHRLIISILSITSHFLRPTECMLI